MKIYFNFSDIINEASLKSSDDISLLSDIYISGTDKVFSEVSDEDIFSVSLKEINMLDLNNPNIRLKDFASLLDNVPLFRINLELLFDDLLLNRHKNNIINRSIEAGFGSKPIPETLNKLEKKEDYDMGGRLYHPMLAHLESDKMGQLYLLCLTELYMLDQTLAKTYDIPLIIGKHEKRFLEFWDAYLFGSNGKANKSLLLKKGKRLDHDINNDFSTYIESSKKIAADSLTNDFDRCLKLYMNEEIFQSRRCKDIDIFLSKKRYNGLPEWLKSDVFKLLSSEAKKQIFASKIIKISPDLKELEGLKLLKEEITNSSKNIESKLLRELLNQTINIDTKYYGAAKEFFKKSKKLQKEYKNL